MTALNKTKYTIIYIRMGWLASTLSDVQTFGFVLGSFAVNSLYLGNNGWLNFCITLMLMTWGVSKAITRSQKSKHVHSLNTTDPTEAINFIKAQTATDGGAA